MTSEVVLECPYCGGDNMYMACIGKDYGDCGYDYYMCETCDKESKVFYDTIITEVLGIEGIDDE